MIAPSEQPLEMGSEGFEGFEGGQGTNSIIFKRREDNILKMVPDFPFKCLYTGTNVRKVGYLQNLQNLQNPFLQAYRTTGGPL